VMHRTLQPVVSEPSPSTLGEGWVRATTWHGLSARAADPHRSPRPWHGLSARASDPRIPTTSILITAFIILLLPTEAHAHSADWHDGHPWYLRWSFNPLVLASLTLLTAAYFIGLARLWRQTHPGHAVSIPQAAAFALGILFLILALVSPIDPIAEELGYVHMIQHMILMMIAAPLLVLGGAGIVFLWAMPRPWRQSLAHLQNRIQLWRPARYLLWQPLVLWTIFAITLWVWHLPALYEAALRSRPIHDLQHLAFVITACLFWRVLFDPVSRLRLSLGTGVLYLFTTSLHATALGVFMALSPVVWYAEYEKTTPMYNLTPLEDQQLAGLIMWMPACTLYALIAAIIFGLWLHRREIQNNHEDTKPQRILEKWA
jgi:putative membrane protein